MSHTHHLHQGHAEIDNYNILFCTNINRHESPVRDYQQYKDYYGVSSFKFPEVTTTVFRTNHTNFCELSFDGTKSTKHHHRRNNTIKHVTSATTINCTTRKQEPIGIEKSPNEGKQVIEKSNKDTTLFHQLAEQFNMKLKFMETPVKLHDNNVVTNQKGSTFEVILSPKTPNSYSSIEAVSNILQSSDHRHKHIIISSKTFQPPPNKPNMRDREIQTKIIGIGNINSVNECFNMGLASVNDIFYNMDILPNNEDLYFSKNKKRKKLNLTMTHLPCIEIKCSSIIFEMPAASARRPQMPRRTLNTNNNSVVGDYHEACNVDRKVSDSITVNSSEATDNLKDKIFNLFSDTQMTANEDFTKKVNDLCALIKSFLSERKNKHGNNTEKSVKLPSEMYINIRKLKADQSNQHIHPITSQKIFSKNSLHQRSYSNPSTPQNRSRSVSPQSQPSTSCQISKMPIAESNIQTSKSSLRCESNASRSKKKGFDTSPNTLSAIQNQSKLSFTSIPSISTISNGSYNIKMALDDETDETQTPQLEKTVPRNVFLIPSHVNEILGKFDYKSPSTNNNTKPTEFQLENIIKKTPAKPSWVVPDFVTKSHLKCDSIHNFQCTKNTKIQNRTDNNFGKSSVTFSSIIDIFGGDNEPLEGQMCQTSDPKTVQNTVVPVTGLIKSKSYPNKQELYAMNNREETNYQNSDLYTVRQIEKKPKLNFEKQSSFYNSGLLTTKKDNNTTSCLQKRKDYDNKLKMQLQMQNKQASKIPLPTTVVEPVIKAVKKPTTKSKLPIIIKNEEIHNKQVICKSNIQAFSKLFTTDIKDTPFSKLKSENISKKQESPLSTPRPTNSFQKSVQKNIGNNLSVTKDVSKEIIFIKYPEPNFHETRYKFKVDFENVDNNLLEQMLEFEKYNNNQKNNILTDKSKSLKLNHSYTSDAKKSLFLSIPAHAASLKLIRLQIEKMKREQQKKQQRNSCSHQNVILVYRIKEKPFLNILKNDSVTKRKKMMKQFRRDDKKNRPYSRIFKETLNIVKDVKFKNSVTKMKPKINKVTFLEPNKWASLCKIQQCNKCDCEKKREQKHSVFQKNESGNETIKNCKESKENSPQLDYSKTKKSRCENLFSRCRIHNKQKENNVTKGESCYKKFCSAKSKSFYKRKDSISHPPEFAFELKRIANNLISCCTTLCCKIDKNTINNSIESIPRSKTIFKKCECQTHWFYVKPPKTQKVYRVNSYRKCNTCLISTSLDILAKRKKPNPAWKFKELIYNQVPNELCNIIKYIKNETFNNSFLHLPINEKQNQNNSNAINEDTKQITKIFPISKNSEGTIKLSTSIIGDTIEKIPNSLRNIKVINKGRFSKKINDSIKNSQTTLKKVKYGTQKVPALTKKIEGTIFIPTSPRKKVLPSKIISSSPRKYNDVEEEFLSFPSKKQDSINHVSSFPKTIEHLKQNVPTFSFPWIRNITSKKVEDSSEKITNIQKQNANNTDEMLQKNKFEDRPIIIFTHKKLDDTKKNNNTSLPVSISPRKRLSDSHPVIFDSATRKIYEIKRNVLISPRQINRDIIESVSKEDQVNMKFQSNVVRDLSNKMKGNNELECMNVFDNKSTSEIQTRIKNEAKTTKVPILKIRGNINNVNTKLLIHEKQGEKAKLIDNDGDIKTKIEENKSLLNKSCARKKPISKLVIETNEIIHIPDDYLIPLKYKESRESKSTEYKSVTAYSGFSSNSQLSISSNSKKLFSTPRTFFNTIGNFFRRYTKKVKKKKSKSMNGNG